MKTPLGIYFRLFRAADVGREGLVLRGAVPVQDFGIVSLSVAVTKATAYANATVGHYTLAAFEISESQMGSLPIPSETR